MRKYVMTIVFLVYGTAALAQLPTVILKDIKGQEINTSTLGNNGKPFIISFLPRGANRVSGN